VALLVEAGRLDWDTRVAEVIPEFGNRGKEVITLRHILSHSAALRQADRVEAPSREAILEMIYDLSLDEGQTPGLHAGYHAGGTWFVLGEVIKRVSGDPVEVFLASNVFEPLGMKGATLGLSAGGLPESFVPMWDTFKRDADQKRIHPIFGTEAGLRMPRPGRSMIGPIRDLARFYEEMRRILLEQSDFISKKTLDEMMVPQRVKGKVDLTFGHPADFGLGFYLHPEKYKVGKVSYGYGRLASEMSFGHSGAQSSCAFFDPPNDLVVAWVCDGMPGELRHQRRARAINEAIYTDLGLDE
ncbi:MAG: serine hydrolase domain-containing protein, partial [Verrucomicrobiota bacterium]